MTRRLARVERQPSSGAPIPPEIARVIDALARYAEEVEHMRRQQRPVQHADPT